jgi:hypothetical protein
VAKEATVVFPNYQTRYSGTILAIIATHKKQYFGRPLLGNCSALFLFVFLFSFFYFSHSLTVISHLDYGARIIQYNYWIQTECPIDRSSIPGSGNISFLLAVLAGFGARFLPWGIASVV